MGTCEQIYQFIVATNIELQVLLSIAISVYADAHCRQNNSENEEESPIYKLLTTNISRIKEKIPTYEAVTKKLFTSETRESILSTVNLELLDTSILLDIFFTITKRYYWNCGKCQNRKRICCKRCNTCMDCHKNKWDDRMVLKDQNEICANYNFTQSLSFARKFRNLFAHVTTTHCKEFAENGKTFEELNICHNFNELKHCARFILKSIVTYTLSKLEDLGERDSDRYKNLDTIRENFVSIIKNGQPLQKYLADNLKKIKDIFEGNEMFYERLEVLKIHIDEHTKIIMSSLEDLKNTIDRNKSTSEESMQLIRSDIKERNKDILNGVVKEFKEIKMTNDKESKKTWMFIYLQITSIVPCD